MKPEMTETTMKKGENVNEHKGPVKVSVTAYGCESG